MRDGAGNTEDNEKEKGTQRMMRRREEITFSLLSSIAMELRSAETCMYTQDKGKTPHSE